MLSADAKDIVIVIDKSQFVRRIPGAYDISKRAALEILDTMESYDRVNGIRMLTFVITA